MITLEMSVEEAEELWQVLMTDAQVPLEDVPAQDLARRIAGLVGFDHDEGPR